MIYIRLDNSSFRSNFANTQFWIELSSGSLVFKTYYCAVQVRNILDTQRNK